MNELKPGDRVTLLGKIITLGDTFSVVEVDGATEPGLVSIFGTPAKVQLRTVELVPEPEEP